MQLRQKIWRKFKPVGKRCLLLLLGTLCCIPRSIGDCVPAGITFYGYRFVNPNLLSLESELAPYFLNLDKIYQDYYAQAAAAQQEENLEEWRTRYCEKATLPDLRFMVYDSRVGELRQLLLVLRDKKASVRSLGPRFANNSFVRYLDRHKCAETIEYLIFAKDCEPHVTDRTVWEQRRSDKVRMQTLIDEGTGKFLQAESHYIKLRYAYQLIRLAHYMRDYDQTLELYDFLLPKIDHDPSILEYWILGHRAGALQALGKRVEAAYYYSLIFDNSAGKRESAYRSFSIRSDAEWQQCLLLCQDDHERATLYVLRANAADARLVEEMQNVYDLDPRHPSLELLMIREMTRLERDLLGQEFNTRRQQNRQYHGVPRADAGERVIELQSFVRKVLAEKTIERPSLWKIAEGYLELLAGDYYYAASTFEAAAKMVDDEQLEEQLTVFRLILEILLIERLDDRQEKWIADLRRDNELYQKYDDFPKLVRDRLIELYQENDAVAKAFLLQHELRDLKVNPQLNLVDDLIGLAQKEEPSKLEEQFLDNVGGERLLYDLLDLKATIYMGRQQIEAALEIYKQMPTTEWGNYGEYNPFVSRFADCVNCKLPLDVTTYNKGELIEAILEKEYEARAETDPDRAAILFYEIGTAFYNMTYFGNAWRASDYFRSGSSAARAIRNRGQTVFSHVEFPLGNQEVFDCSRARSYFDRARMLARDPEIAARITYEAAKCERNAYYTTTQGQVGRTYEYFDILLNQYRETAFVQTAIAECKTFAAYAAR